MLKIIKKNYFFFSQKKIFKTNLLRFGLILNIVFWNWKVSITIIIVSLNFLANLNLLFKHLFSSFIINKKKKNFIVCNFQKNKVKNQKYLRKREKNKDFVNKKK